MTKFLPFFLALGIGALVVALLMSSHNKQSASSMPAPSGEYASQTTGELLPVGPDEANCPVMGMVGKKADMVTVIEKGNMYYLCCQTCLPKFKAAPERYIKYPAPPTSRVCQ